MKNFTNNFKQFASRLSARWLIMALMLLLGTSSAWANKAIYLDPGVWNTDNPTYDVWAWKSGGNGVRYQSTKVGSYYQAIVPDEVTHVIWFRRSAAVSGTGWSDTNVWNRSSGDAGGFTSGSTGKNLLKITGWGSKGNSTWSTSYYDDISTYTVSGTSSTVKLSDSDKWVTYTLYKDGAAVSNSGKTGTGSELSWTVTTSGIYTIKGTNTYKTKDMSGSYTYNPCTQSVSEGAGLYSNGDITLSAKFNTCGTAYIGFQWKEKNDSWCYDNNADCYVMLGEQNKSNEEVTTTLTKTGGVFVFRPYIVVGSTAQEWLYGTEFEVATCTSINDFTLTFEDGNELGLANNTQANLSTDAEVNWSSTNDQIASVSNSGVVTGYKWGTAIITATTTGNDEYCANQTASANITIKEFPRISISGTTPFCGETTELTASIDNISKDNTEYTISWYKEGDVNVKGTGATFNASEGVYYAKVTGDFLETATSDQLTVTKKSTPTVANFNYEAPDNLEYNNETKTATVIWNSTQGGAITIAYSSSNSTVTPVDPINVGKYYVFVSTVEDEEFCAVNNLYIGTFTITCPEVAAPAIDATNTIIQCGSNYTQKGQIAITKKMDGLTYTCNLNGTTDITIPDNGVISEITTPGTYTITATNGCGNNASTEVEISLTDNTVSISAITGSETICSGSSQDYSVTVIEDVEYKWSINPDSEFTLGTNGNNSIEVTAKGDKEASASLSLTVSKNGCETSIQQPKTITLIPLPTITTVDPTSGEACSNTTIADLEKDLTITKSANTNTKWYFNAAEQDVTAMLQAGDYTIKAITETGGCISSQGIVYTVTNIAESPDAPFANNTSEDICESYNEFNLTELVDWDAEAPENENITISWYTKDGENYIPTDADQYTIAANTFYARTQNETGCYSDYVALVIPTPIKPATLNLTTTPANGITTPWVAIQVTVDGSKGAYTVSYPNNLNTVKNIQITKEGDTYTYLIPRPSAWGTGDDPNQNSGKKQVDYTVRATLNGGSESCPSMGEVIIHLQDEANDTCNH